jgi:uncharacterized protein
VTQPVPVAPIDRIESLDVIRGFALLGILLLNILGFGLVSSGYFNPEVGGGSTPLELELNLAVWAGVDVFFEGAMRCLFSLLFGAGVVLFTSSARERGGVLHYRRNFWLLVFGLFDAYLLLWSGDVLVTYALAGMALYPLRNLSPRKLAIGAGVLIVLMSLMYLVFSFSLDQGRQIHDEASGSTISDPTSRELAAAWEDFYSEYELSPEATQAELMMRQDSFLSAFAFNREVMTEVLVFVIPVILFWDALAMMLLGMALFKWRILDASRSSGFYLKLTLIGFGVGLFTNLYELVLVYATDFDPLTVHGYMRPTYHLGRLAMALGYLGLVMLFCREGWLAAARMRLAAVGRMALTNYLMHSLMCLFIFTGAGLALVGELQRWQLYLIVVAIWVLQLVISPWWLARYQFGPVEWLWRTLTYGRWPPLKR